MTLCGLVQVYRYFRGFTSAPDHSAIQYNVIRAGAWSGVRMRTFGITTVYPSEIRV